MNHKTIDHVFSQLLAVLEITSPEDQQREFESRRNFFKKAVENYFKGELTVADAVSKPETVRHTDMVPPEMRGEMSSIVESTYFDLKKKYEDECTKNETLRRRIDSLCASLQKFGATAQPSDIAGGLDHISWKDFLEMGSMKFRPVLPRNSEKGFQQAFISATNNDYKFNDFTRWRRTGKVPMEAVTRLHSLVIEPVKKKENRWTKEEQDIFRNFTCTDENGYINLVAGFTQTKLAQLLTERFGREITEGSIKGKLLDARGQRTKKSKKETTEAGIVTPGFTKKPAEVKEQANG